MRFQNSRGARIGLAPRLFGKTALECESQATPCTYSVAGRQYVVIAAGGGGKLATKSGDAFVAFALK